MVLIAFTLPGMLLGALAGAANVRMRIFATVVALVGFGWWYIHEKYVAQPKCREAALGDCALGPVVPVANAIAFVLVALVILAVTLVTRSADPDPPPSA